MSSHQELNIIIPAHNEEKVITRCLKSLVNQDYKGAKRLLVVANGCKDNTVRLSNLAAEELRYHGWDVEIFDLDQASKTSAINFAEGHIAGGIRIYLDADIELTNASISRLEQILRRVTPCYASGRMRVVVGGSIISKLYSKAWLALPFHKYGVQGAGLYAVNDLGRKRWAEFPELIADDYFVRLQFSPHERFMSNAEYTWPLPNGFRNLVRTRARQDYGNAQLRAKFPDIFVNEDKHPNKPLLNTLFAFQKSPIGFVIYVLVRLCARIRRSGQEGSWGRGR